MILTTILATLVALPLAKYMFLAIQISRAAITSQYANPKVHVVQRDFKKRFWWQGQLFFSILFQPRSVLEVMFCDEYYNQYYSVKPNLLFPTIKVK
ncbi:hypothetical protein VCHA53O466_140139 [Vibrio chagasii]|nr:hypothetical protein VCHA53O466_140139 [Vibrio chagasii]